jgi:hypothetical protein
MSQISPIRFATSRIVNEDYEPFRFDPQRAMQAVPRVNFMKEILEETAPETFRASQVFPKNPKTTSSVFLLGAVLVLFVSSWFLLFQTQTAEV